MRWEDEDSPNLSSFLILLCNVTYTDTHTKHAYALTHSCKTTWLPAASPPASSAARDLARLIIFLLIECRGTLQGWVIKLMQRMFVSTVYLSAAKRYIRLTAHMHKHRQTQTQMQGCTYACAYEWYVGTQSRTDFVSLKHMEELHAYTKNDFWASTFTVWNSESSHFNFPVPKVTFFQQKKH